MAAVPVTRPPTKPDLSKIGLQSEAAPRRGEAKAAADASSGRAIIGPWKLTYYDAPTRGEQVRLLLTLAKVEWEDVRLKGFPQGSDHLRHAAMGDDSPLMFDQVPLVTAPDGTNVVQVAACMQFVGRKTGLAPEDPEADAMAMALTLASEELRNGVFYPLFKPNIIHYILTQKCCGLCCCLGWCGRCCAGERKIKPGLSKWLGFLEAALRKAGSRPFLLGDRPFYCDVALMDSVRETAGMPCFDRAAELRAFPCVSAWLERMEAIPEIAAYYKKRGGGECGLTPGLARKLGWTR